MVECACTTRVCPGLGLGQGPGRQGRGVAALRAQGEAVGPKSIPPSPLHPTPWPPSQLRTRRRQRRTPRPKPRPRRWCRRRPWPWRRRLQLQQWPLGRGIHILTHTHSRTACWSPAWARLAPWAATHLSPPWWRQCLHPPTSLPLAYCCQHPPWWAQGCPPPPQARPPWACPPWYPPLFPCFLPLLPLSPLPHPLPLPLSPLWAVHQSRPSPERGKGSRSLSRERGLVVAHHPVRVVALCPTNRRCMRLPRLRPSCPLLALPRRTSRHHRTWCPRRLWRRRGMLQGQ